MTLFEGYYEADYKTYKSYLDGTSLQLPKRKNLPHGDALWILVARQNYSQCSRS